MRPLTRRAMSVMARCAATSQNQLVRSAEQRVKRDWEKNGRKYYFDKHVFEQCWSDIWRMIKISSVKDVLMKYHLIEDEGDIRALTNPALDSKQQADNLLYKIVPKAEDYGYYLLYMAIRDSMSSNPLGHNQIVKELKKHAKGRQPPWQIAESQPIQETCGIDNQTDRRPPGEEELVAGSIPLHAGERIQQGAGGGFEHTTRIPHQQHLHL